MLAVVLLFLSGFVNCTATDDGTQQESTSLAILKKKGNSCLFWRFL